jgi:WW domain-containing oxidoreductase
MFAMEADIRWKDVCCLAVHPGNMISTHLSRHWWVYRLLFATVRPFAKSIQQAAGTIIFAAAASDLQRTGGLYINNCFLCKPSYIVEDQKARIKLWDLSVDILMNKLEQIEKDPNYSSFTTI